MDYRKYLLRAYNGHVLMIAFLVGLFAMVMIAVQQNLAPSGKFR